MGQATLRRDIVVIGASAGGVEALSSLVRQLPEDFPASIFVVVHISENAKSVLPAILQRAGKLPVSNAEEGTRFELGRIYVAPPGRHLLLKHDHMHLVYGPKENSARPAVDPLFRTAAGALGARVIGVVLSGALDDGTAGLAEIKAGGGVAVVLDPDDALYPGMPESALEAVDVDHVVELEKLGTLLEQLVAENVEVDATKPEPDAHDGAGSQEEDPLVGGRLMKGAPSGLTCPECHGALFEQDAGENVVRFECHVGHAFTPEGLANAQANDLEGALWTALRALEESAMFAARMAERMAGRGAERSSQRFRERAEELRRRAAIVREALLDEETTGVPAAQANTANVLRSAAEEEHDTENAGG